MRRSNFFIAVTGQREEEPSEGILRTLILSLVCKVLDHLIMTLIPGGANMRSPLESCFRGSYEEIEWGTRLDILTKLKKDINMAALKIWPMYMESVHWIILLSMGISMIGFIVGLKGLCLMIALLYNLIRGSLKAEVSMPYEDRVVLTAER